MLVDAQVRKKAYKEGYPKSLLLPASRIAERFGSRSYFSREKHGHFLQSQTVQSDEYTSMGCLPVTISYIKDDVHDIVSNKYILLIVLSEPGIARYACDNILQLNKGSCMRVAITNSNCKQIFLFLPTVNTGIPDYHIDGFR